jgi:hypothetical protein
MAQPEALLVFSELDTGGGEPLVMRMLLGQGVASICDVEEDGLSMSPPLPYADLVNALARHLENGQVDLPPTSLWPSQLKLIAWIFTEGPKSMSRADANKRLAAGAQLKEADAATLVQELIGAKLLVEQGGQLSLAKPLLPLIERMGTGHMAELVLTVYGEDGKPASRDEVRFFGKPKDRVTALSVKGEMLKAATGGKATEDTLIHVTAPPRGGMHELLRAFLGVEQ